MFTMIIPTKAMKRMTIIIITIITSEVKFLSLEIHDWRCRENDT